MERGEKSLIACRACTGVEMRFVMKSDTVTIRMGRRDPTSTVNNNIIVYRGGIQITLRTLVTSEYKDIVIKQPSGFENYDVMKKVSEDAGNGWDPNVIRVIFNRGAFRIMDIIDDVEPPKPEQAPAKTLLTYAPTCWASLLAYRLKTDHLNMGFVGSCWMEPEIVKYLTELGINCLSWEEDKIYERVRLVLREVAGKNPDKPIFVVSPSSPATTWSRPPRLPGGVRSSKS